MDSEPEPTNLEQLVSELASRLEDELEASLRRALEAKEPAWLVEQLVEHVLTERRLGTAPRSLTRHGDHVEPPQERRRRLRRIRELKLDEKSLKDRIARYKTLDRQRLTAESFLLGPPHKGKRALGPADRSEAGNGLLREAEDLLYALLFGDESQNVRLPRSQREFLTLILPTAKKDRLERFMLAVTEMPAKGTWLDPEGVSDDVDASNTILQVEFGDSPDQQVSDALIAVLRLLNDLEINEEILYARIEQIQRSSLVR